MSTTPVRFAIIGPAGFGASHVRAIETLAAEGAAVLAAVVSRPGEHPEAAERLRAQGVPLYPSVEALLGDAGAGIEVVTVPTSIYSHAPLTIQALDAGHHVYCEKPAAATLQEVDAMIAARDRADRLCTVGFQDIASPALQRAKEALWSGRIGRPRLLKAHCLWPRGDDYYGRNEWSGKLRVGEAWVLDGPANNAAAHTLMNLLYLAGPERFAPTVPVRVTAELYRANAIETYDTCSLRVRTAEDVELLFYVTHAGERNEPPYMEVVGERGSLRRWGAQGNMELRVDGAEPETWSNGDLNPLANSFRHFSRCVRGEAALLHPVENARPHTLVMNGAHASTAIHPLPAALCARANADRGGRTFVRGLDDTILRAFEQSRLLSEAGVEWGIPGREMDVHTLTRFPPETTSQ
jgi:predicted dehydrogenase